MKLYELNKYFVFLLLSIVLLSCSGNQEEEVDSNQEIGVINFYFEKGRYFDALAEVDALSAEALDDPELRFIVAKIYLEIGYPDHAQEILEKLQAESHELEDIDLLIIKALYKQHKTTAAKELLLSSEIQSKYSSHPELILLHAQIEFAEYNLNASKNVLLKFEENSSAYPEVQVWLAKIDLLENREAKAVERIEKVLENTKEIQDAWLLLADIHFSKKEYLDAENHYLQALRLDDSKILTQQSLQIAQNIVLAKTALGNSIAGEDFYQSFLDSYPKSPMYYFELARLAYLKNDLKVAEKNLSEVLKTVKNNPRMIALLAKILIKQDKLEDAGDLLQQHIANAIGGMDLIVIVLKAITDMELGKHQAAIDLLSNYALENEASRAVLTPLLAYLHLKNNEKNKYSELLRAYKIEDADSVKGINSARTIYLEIGKFDEAENFLEKLIDYYPNSNEIKVLYLSTLNDIGKNEDISGKINQWLSETSDNATLRLISINQAIGNGSYKSVIKQFNSINAKNLSAQEENLLADNIRNLVLKTRGQDDQKAAFNLLVHWQQVLSDNVQLNVMLADIYISDGVYKKAVPLYESVLEQYPDNHVILNNLAWSYFSLDDGRALATAEKAYASNPNDAPVSDTLGWILVEKGKPEKGLKFIQQALEIDPDNKDIQEHYQFARAMLNNQTENQAE